MRPERWSRARRRTPMVSYRIVVAPGDYVVTADAGMWCELMEARVTDGEYAEVDIPCDTGIR